MQWSEPGRRFGPPRTIGAVNAPALVENQCRPKGKVAAGATACGANISASRQRRRSPPSRLFRGRSLSGHRPAEAMAAVVAIIHQHFMLIEAMTVVENVMLGWSQAGWILKRADIAAHTRDERAVWARSQSRRGHREMPLGGRQRVVACGAIAGLGGAVLSLQQVGTFTDGMTGGRGNLALASLIVARWNPLGAALACLAFGAAEAFELRLQSFSVPVNSYVVQMAPYLIALAVLAGLGRTSRMPAAIGQPLPWDQ
jgi:hypothetical protein